MRSTKELRERITRTAVTGYRAALGHWEHFTKRKIVHPATRRLAVERWLQDVADAPPVKASIVIFALRSNTWIEWAAYTACWMRSLGYAPIILYSSADEQRAYRQSPLKATLGLGASILPQLRRVPDATMIDLDGVGTSPADEAMFRELAEDFAPTVAAYDLLVEEHEGGSIREEYLAQSAQSVERLCRVGAATYLLLVRLKQQRELAGLPIKRVLVYSGLIGATPAVTDAARRAGLDFMTVEGWAWRKGHMICGLNHPALAYDIEAWLGSLERRGVDTTAHAREFMSFQESGVRNSEWLNTFHHVQRASVDSSFPPRVKEFLDAGPPPLLLAPNVVGDSSTLRRATVFRSQRDWVESVVRFVAEHPDLRLIVRSHPAEIWARAKVRERFGELARNAAGNAPNVLVIDADASLNTHKLFPHVVAGLVWISSVGVDMAIRGIPVIAAARANYGGLGIVNEPNSRDDYFAALTAAARGELRPPAASVTMAQRYHTIVFGEFSYRAFGLDFRAHDITIDPAVEGAECLTFYKVLAGDLPPTARA